MRDAQRSARDTEILVTLVRAAAEMRNSFEDMKRLLADTEDVIITEVQQNTDKSVQKAINGPRPQPASAPRSVRQGSHDDMFDDLPAKKRNVFRKALKGLSLRSNNDLGKIEDMLVQLLGDVEGLKGAQMQTSQNGASFEDLRGEGASEQDRGYEAEGNAGTSTASHASQSGQFSLPRSQGNASRGFEGRKFSDHRISTVHEGDEEELSAEERDAQDDAYEHDDGMLTPTREMTRAGSMPMDTPPQQSMPPASISNDNTPTTDKSKKGKSSGPMGWIPKVKRWSGSSTPKMSRWSETTASSVLKGFRSSGRSSTQKTNEPFTGPISRSGSELGEFAEHDLQHDPYGEDKLHTGFSQDSFHDHQPTLDAMSMLPPEDPKYKAHRNSLNLQHPQPRPHATVRYQTALEHQAQDYQGPKSPRSLDWGSQVSLNQLPPSNNNRYSDATQRTGNMSPISDGGYSDMSAADQTVAPLRPPKVPEVPPKIGGRAMHKPSPLGGHHLSMSGNDFSQAPTNSRGTHTRALSGNLVMPARKPTGPRSMGTASPRSEVEGQRNTNRGMSSAPSDTSSLY